MELYEKLKSIKEKYSFINQQLTDPGIISDQSRMISLSKERRELEEIVQAFNEYEELMKNIVGNQELLTHLMIKSL